ncbi:MAG: cell division protein FtsZ [Odoribacteraceae bacterium]|jgi:cell division protein FtsZ|nr:cell division protein FtsZ [Odoribacteraceae bacterium]
MIEGLLNFDQDEVSPVIIKVIGVGGGGGNAVEYMLKEGIRDVDFVVCDTDKQVLDQLLTGGKVKKTIQLGESKLKGLGTGKCTEWGEDAARESEREIKDMLRENTKMAFITATMGGGTGTGAAPLIAKWAKEMGILTVGVVAFPMRLDGDIRLGEARKGIELMHQNVDSLIVIDNEKICELHGSKTCSDAFATANDVLRIAVKGIVEIITLPGHVNVDFADVKTVMTNSHMAIMGAAKASGNDRASKVIAEALNHPLLSINDLSGAKDILLSISSGIDDDEISVDELMEITSYVTERVREVSVIWGVGKDESLGGDISVTIIATGLPFVQVDDVPPPLPPDEPKEGVYQARLAYVESMLNERDILLQPNLPDEKIQELKATPAHIRRGDIKVKEI